ncbi:MAG TPA: cyclopropane-fatty-acyl-phospholipid synthase family protein, partial [Chloroflexia bacterium]|nr:cyclopropane-fatty-acyl-phospholipid synthase family protein [Chloroflexia bacterium]
GEAYLRDDFDIEGDIEAATALADGIANRLNSPLALARLMMRLASLPARELSSVPALQDRAATDLAGKQHSLDRDATAVRYHYDVGNDFYALWLDRRMVYSCAYFRTGGETLDEAQEAKLEHICRKLRLQRGERLLDIGCGWGGLIMYAAERFGVHATGITLSKPQAELARKRIDESGLGGRCRVEVRDYREMPAGVQFDKIASVGMVEHVGRANLPRYFAQAYRLLRPGGLFLNHGIVDLRYIGNMTHNNMGQLRIGGLERLASRATSGLASKLWKRGQFGEKYVFPDGELLRPCDMVKYGEDAGFETRDMESLREHYTLTLRHWVRRLEAHHEEAVRIAGEVTYRIWRLYMAAGAHGFACGDGGLIQTLLSKQDGEGHSLLPLTREDLYAYQGVSANSRHGG